MVSTADPNAAGQVAFLSQPESYRHGPAAVEVIETHFAWVFLADPFAYKLKKPLRFHDFDLTTLAARRANCELEVSLNRRLAAAVYIGTVALTADGNRWQLEGAGTPIAWLVKMHRLPTERTLERAAATRTLVDTDLEAVFDKLARFYARAVKAPWDGPAYRAALHRRITEHAGRLAAPALATDAGQVDSVAARLTRFVDDHAALLDARVAAGRIVDAHGDLRPEHIFLTTPEPQIIDCLEFSAELRLLDSAAEAAFLALECERLGFATLAGRIIDGYRKHCADDVADCLLGFYGALNALMRALLAAWHLEDVTTPGEATFWRSRTAWYLEHAARALDLQGAAPRLRCG